jgi:two-component system, OmpR family, KDP operon response regulator KdpE
VFRYEIGMNPSRILVVDDDDDIRSLLVALFERAGYSVTEAATGRAGLRAMYEAPPDLILLDVGMPELDGWQTLERIRDLSDVPVVMLTARAGELDKVRGLRSGADDYVTKPFGVEEVLARLRAALRRSQAGEPSPPVHRFGELEVDVGRRLVTVTGSPVHLTKTEYALLEAFVTNPGKLLTHQWLLRKVWGPGYAQESHYLRVYVRSLRRKLGDEASAPRLILTEPGVGYRWIAVRAEGGPS